MSAFTLCPVPPVGGCPIGFTLGRRAERAFVRGLRPLGLRTVEFRVLSIVAQRTDRNQADIAAALGVDPGNLVAVMTRMIDEGWVRRERDAVDRRRYGFRLTAAGSRRHRQARNALAAQEQALVAALSPAEVERLRLTLAKLIASTAAADAGGA